MKKIKCLVVGSGGREASIIEKLKDDCKVYAFMGHENPGIISAVNLTGGSYTVGDIIDGKSVRDFALKCGVEIAVINNDNILEAGVVDELRKSLIPTFGPTREGAKIEWSKSFSREIISYVDSEMNLKYITITSDNQLDQAFEMFKDQDIVVKPDGLTGGKGVKVMGEHLKDKQEAFNYAKTIVNSSGKVVLEEKIDGYEFTIMGITDGKEIVISPVTYDYPYRYDNDEGPGTGGMGCFTSKSGMLPFLNNGDMLKCKKFMQKVVKRLNSQEQIFNGVVNGGFFKTKEGNLKTMEFNARIGDPECLNVMELLETPLIEVIKACINGNLSEKTCKFKEQTASLVVYLVSKDYAIDKKSGHCEFNIDQNAVENGGGKVIYGSCKRVGNYLVSMGSSRLAAIVMSGEDLSQVRRKLYKLIDENVTGPVDFRRDIASEGKLLEMSRM